MIIKFILETKHARTNEVTYWFQVKLPEYQWTDIYVGFDKSGEWISASNTFFQLDKETQQKAIEEAKPLLAKIIK